MTDKRVVWEDMYLRRGNLWGGSTLSLPEFTGRTRVLELGCGNGKVLSSLRQQECDVVGLDFSRAAVSCARANLPDSWQGNIVLSDARDLPFLPESFDAVIARHVIGHMTREGRGVVAQEIMRVLRKGGNLFFSGFSREDFRYGQGSPVEDGTRMRGNGISTHYFTQDGISSLFSGLLIESLHERRWILRIRGKDHIRSEIHAIFRKART